MIVLNIVGIMSTKDSVFIITEGKPPVECWPILNETLCYKFKLEKKGFSKKLRSFEKSGFKLTYFK